VAIHRSVVAGTLWPEVRDERAAASLRTAIWSLPKDLPSPVVAEGTHLRLSPTLEVDYYTAWDQVNELIDPDATTDVGRIDLGLLSSDLLSEWSEDWILIEQEGFRQMRLHALEALSERLSERGFGARAVQAGMAAVAAEPLRETAHRALIRAYVAEGNRGDALRQFHSYERLVRLELGLEPSGEMRDLLSTLIRPDLVRLPSLASASRIHPDARWIRRTEAARAHADKR